MQQHPITATCVAFIVAIFAGVIDLVVLKNRTVALIFWGFGLIFVVTPVLSIEPTVLIGSRSLLCVLTIGIGLASGVRLSLLLFRDKFT